MRNRLLQAASSRPGQRLAALRLHANAGKSGKPGFLAALRLQLPARNLSVVDPNPITDTQIARAGHIENPVGTTVGLDRHAVTFISARAVVLCLDAVAEQRAAHQPQCRRGGASTAAAELVANDPTDQTASDSTAARGPRTGVASVLAR